METRLYYWVIFWIFLEILKRVASVVFSLSWPYSHSKPIFKKLLILSATSLNHQYEDCRFTVVPFLDRVASQASFMILEISFVPWHWRDHPLPRCGLSMGSLLEFHHAQYTKSYIYNLVDKDKIIYIERKSGPTKMNSDQVAVETSRFRTLMQQLIQDTILPNERRWLTYQLVYKPEACCHCYPCNWQTTTHHW